MSWSVAEIVDEVKKSSWNDIIPLLISDFRGKVGLAIQAAALINEELNAVEEMNTDDLKMLSDLLLQNLTQLSEMFDTVSEANKSLADDISADLSN